MLEAGHEHTHEAHRSKVVDRAKLLLILGERYAELIPVDRFLVAIAQWARRCTLVHDVVLANLQVFRTYGNVILEVLLVFIERIVLVDVLHIRS